MLHCIENRLWRIQNDKQLPSKPFACAKTSGFNATNFGNLSAKEDCGAAGVCGMADLASHPG